MQENSTKHQQSEQNIMGYMPCARLVVTMSLPMMMSMLMQALYNVVDSVFVSYVGESALTAVSLAFPIQSVLIAIISGTGVGMNARLSRKLGEGKHKDAWITAGNGIFLAMLYALSFFVLGFFVPTIFYNALTDDPEIVRYGIDYSSVIMIVAAGCVAQMTSERLLQSTGKTFYSMIIQGSGALLNIILDPIMIFGLLGFPAMGTRGAAIATVTGQVVAACLGVAFNLKVNRELRFGLAYLRPRPEVIGEIYKVGIPSIVMQGIGSVMNFGMNKILLGFTSTAATVFGVYFKLQSFVFMPIFGMNSAVVPIVAFNFGARKPDRIRETIKFAVLLATGIMLIGLAVFELFPERLLYLFNPSDTLLEIGVPAFRIIALHFVLAGFDCAMSSLFQALGESMKSLWISVIRQVVVLLPLGWILARAFGLAAVWYTFPLSELVSFALCAFFLRRAIIKDINPLAGPPAGSVAGSSAAGSAAAQKA